MAGQNDFLPFATDVGANVLSQADWAALPSVGDGFAAGIAVSQQLNKAWRQSSTMANVIAAFIIGQDPAQDVLDNGVPATIVAQFLAAVQQAATRGAPVAVVTDGADFVASLAVAKYALNRVTSLAALQNITLPVGMVAGATQQYQDIKGNAFANKVKFSPPAGTISGAADWTMGEDKMTATFTYYGGNLYGVQAA